MRAFFFYLFWWVVVPGFVFCLAWGLRDFIRYGQIWYIPPDKDEEE